MKCVRVGNGCGFWGDNLDAPTLLSEHGRLDYLTLEYLAELTMSILALQKQRDPQAGYATDFIDVLERLATILANQPGLRILSPGHPSLSAGHLVTFDFDKRPLDLAFLRMAEEIALFLGAIVVLPPEGAAAIRGEDRLADLALGKSVQVAAENRLQVVFLEPREYIFGIPWPADDPGAERKMRENHGRPLLV